MEDILWYLLGWLNLVLGSAIWRTYRQGHTPSATSLALTLVAGHLGWENGSMLWGYGGLLRFVVLSFFFHCSSPILAFWVYGLEGGILRWSWNIFGFLSLTGYATVLLSRRPAPGLESLASRVLVGAGLAFLPLLWPSLQRLLRNWHTYRHRSFLKRQERTKSQQQRRKENRRRKEDSKQTESLTKERIQLERHKQRKERETRKKAAQRQEILSQVKQLRVLETNRIQEGTEGLYFHPHFGFLMAEAARTLRAEIANGERIPPLENDTFLLEVIERLLADEAFQERYFHRQGKKTIAAVSRYLIGRLPLGDALVAVHAEDLKLEQIAPTPVLGELAPELLEGWLVPHRRWQERMRQRYLEQKHPQQMAIAELLDEDDTPTSLSWRQAWDATPWVFVKEQEEVSR